MFDLNEIEEHGLRAGCGGPNGGGGSSGGRREQQAQTDEESLEQADTTPALGSMKLSSDQRMLACTIDLDGSDRFVLAVFDLIGGAGEAVAQARGSGSPRQGPPTLMTVLREDTM